MTVLEDFCTFAKGQLESGDIDPMYPVLSEFYEAEELHKAQALWRTLLYVVFYHVGSAEQVWRRYPTMQRVELWPMPTGIERRGFRGNGKAQELLNTLVDHVRNKHGGRLDVWADEMVQRRGEQGWADARQAFEQFRFNGPWASYKWADLLKHVHGYDITADDIGVGGKGKAAGPIPGMVILTGKHWRECAEDVALQKRLLDECVMRGVPFDGLDQLETALCDFNSLYRGRYYVGHDIDMQMEHLKQSSAGLWEARARAFPACYLGERNGWFGVRKKLKTLYRDRRQVWAA